ncbi:hypothetical protein CKM354_000141900 [Cercospora kikuchii]|uniref:Uncharacterized protein n=1 Tax=Cercospora kikuchii TaxID=84275 RepID=A0A9P3C797_9PEZI|nr:uncharacterized protein CKM354_000141900 [Cercospora kikuchii]GIZ37992.1 hypothetical protein CKM354_000141900 [Cercospora kikuchii]
MNTDEDSDTSRDEVQDSPMRDAPDTKGDISERLRGVQLDSDRTSIEAVANGKVKSMAREVDARTSTTKPARPSGFAKDPGVVQPQKQHESSGWLRSGASLFKGLVSPARETVEASEERYEMQLAQLKSKIEDLERKSRVKSELLTKQESANEKALQDADSRNAMKLQNLKEWHKADCEEIEQNARKDLHRQKTSYERTLASQKDKHEKLLQHCEREAAKQTCRGYEEKFRAQEMTIGKLQSATFKTVESSQWASLDTSKLLEQLTSIQKGVRRWSKEHASLTVDQVADPEGFTSFVRALAGKGCVPDPQRLHERLLLNKSQRDPGRIAAMVLSAAVMHDIFFNVIGHSFFAFQGQPEENLLPHNLGVPLRTLLSRIATYDIAGAEALRCQLLRLLDPITKEATSHEAQFAKQVAASSRSRAVCLLAVNIIDAYLGLLTQEQRQKAYDGLCAIIEEAAELAWALGTRKASIHVRTWAGLQHSDQGVIPFRASSEIFEAHIMHNNMLDDDPNALDGRDIVLVCSPAIFAYGNAEGEDYDKAKVLKKAIAWMG